MPEYFVQRQPGDLGVLRGVINGFSKEARTRGFASLTLVRFAFVSCNCFLSGKRVLGAIGGVTERELLVRQ